MRHPLVVAVLFSASLAAPAAWATASASATLDWASFHYIFSGGVSIDATGSSLTSSVASFDGTSWVAQSSSSSPYSATLSGVFASGSLGTVTTSNVSARYAAHDGFTDYATSYGNAWGQVTLDPGAKIELFLPYTVSASAVGAESASAFAALDISAGPGLGLYTSGHVTVGRNGDLSNAIGGTLYLSYTNLTGAAKTLIWTGSESTYAETSVAAIPEPETYGMLIGGLGLIGFMVRRKQRPAT